MDVLLGLVPVENVTAFVRPEERLYFVQYLNQIAHRVRGESLKILSRLANPFLGEIVRRATVDDAERRARAVHTIAMLGGPQQIPILRQALEDPSPLVVMVAARGIVHANVEGEGHAILAHINRFEHWSPSLLASTLAACGTELGPELCRVLADREQAPWFRAVAAAALSRLRYAPAAEHAVLIIEQESDREVVAAALQLLGSLRIPVGIEAVRGRLSDVDPVLRVHATRTMGRLGRRHDANFMVTLLSDTSPWVAIRAAQAILDLGAEDLLLEAEKDGRASTELVHEAMDARVIA